MAKSTNLAERQRRALDQLKPLADALGLYLAGGTAVAWHLRHRLSRDLDLFSREPDLDLAAVHAAMTALPGVEVVSRYPYRTLQEPRGEQVPIASLEDLAVMKLAAIARRGIRRDFWDLHAIVSSGAWGLDHALRSYVRRYGVKESDLYHVMRALTFFDDAEADRLLPEGLSPAHWTEIKGWFATQVPIVMRRFI